MNELIFVSYFSVTKDVRQNITLRDIYKPRVNFVIIIKSESSLTVHLNFSFVDCKTRMIQIRKEMHGGQ